MSTFVFLLGIKALAGVANNTQASIYDYSWKWIDESGQKIDLREFNGSRVVLSMTYLSCKMSCPMTIRMLKDVSADLEKKGIHAHFVVMSFDPRLDSPVRRAKYKKSWNLPEKYWHFLTGSPDDLKALAQFLKFKYREVDDHFIHDKTISVLDASGRIEKQFEDWNDHLLGVI